MSPKKIIQYAVTFNPYDKLCMLKLHRIKLKKKVLN